MNKSHRHEAAFKLEVARIVVNQGLSLGRTAVSRWSAQYQTEQLRIADIGKQITAEQQRIANWRSRTAHCAQITNY